MEFGGVEPSPKRGKRDRYCVPYRNERHHKQPGFIVMSLSKGAQGETTIVAAAIR